MHANCCCSATLSERSLAQLKAEIPNVPICIIIGEQAAALDAWSVAAVLIRCQQQLSPSLVEQNVPTFNIPQTTRTH